MVGTRNSALTPSRSMAAQTDSAEKPGRSNTCPSRLSTGNTMNPAAWLIGEQAKDAVAKLERQQHLARVHTTRTGQPSSQSDDHAIDEKEQKTAPWLAKKQKPNAACACGSGKKFKKCW